MEVGPAGYCACFDRGCGLTLCLPGLSELDAPTGLRRRGLKACIQPEQPKLVRLARVWRQQATRSLG